MIWYNFHFSNYKSSRNDNFRNMPAIDIQQKLKLLKKVQVLCKSFYGSLFSLVFLPSSFLWRNKGVFVASTMIVGTEVVYWSKTLCCILALALEIDNPSIEAPHLLLFGLVHIRKKSKGQILSIWAFLSILHKYIQLWNSDYKQFTAG